MLNAGREMNKISQENTESKASWGDGGVGQRKDPESSQVEDDRSAESWEVSRVFVADTRKLVPERKNIYAKT